MTEDLSIRPIPIRYASDLKELKTFLEEQGLRFEENIETAYGVFDREDRLVGCGCGEGSVLKCFAIAKELRGQNALGPLLSALEQDRFLQGFFDLSVITRIENVPLFIACGLYLTAGTEKIAMLENLPDGPEAYSRPFWQAGDENRTVGAIVLNGNPFTLGHRHLIETAVGQCDVLHVFVVEEDRSFFSADDRLAMVREGTKDLSCVRVHPSGRYMISAATFPTYFLKEEEDAARLQSELDATLFARRIAPALHITKRFAGEEPRDPVTKGYNRALSAILPENGVTFIEIPRLEKDGSAVSASRVRTLLREKGLCPEVFSLVPTATGRYLSDRFGERYG